MNLTQFSNHLSFSFAIQELGLVKPSVYYGKTLIWIEGQSHSGQLKTAILGLSPCMKEFTKAYVVSTENGMGQYSYRLSKNPLGISIQEVVTLWTKLIEGLCKEPWVPIENLRYITGDHIGHQLTPCLVSTTRS